MHCSTYIYFVSWGVDLHSEVSDWLLALPEKDYENIVAALDALVVDGPNLGRPFVDHIKGSEHPNMKELRPRGKHFRLLFAFDPKRRAIFLVAGDKSNDWEGWYKRNIPVADKRFNEHLKDIEKGMRDNG